MKIGLLLAHRDSTVSGTLKAQLLVRVCMHIRGVACTDYRVMREATALVEAGFQVSIVDIEYDQLCPLEEDISGISVKHIFRASSFISPRFNLWSFFKTMRSHIYSVYQLMQIPTDIYHAHDMAALPACYIAALLRRKPLVFDAHELPLSELDGTYWYRFRNLFNRSLAMMVPRCAGVITVSPLIAREIRSRYHASKISLVRNVPTYRMAQQSDRLRQYLKLGPGVHIALYQGNLQPNRGLEMLIRAAAYLNRESVIVLMGKGVGATRSQLESLIISEGVVDRVKILPQVPYTELLDWTASAEIGLIIYSPDHSLNVKMCLPNKLFEYLMAGLPVLSSQLDAVVEVIGAYEVGKIVSSLAPAELGAEINAMFADCTTLTCMRHNALEAARRDLNWEKERQHLIHLYQNIVTVRNA